MNNEIFKKEKLMMIITAVISGLVIMYAFVEDEIGIISMIAGTQLALTLYTIYSVTDYKKINRNIIICIVLSCLHFNIPNVLLLVWVKESMEHSMYKINAPPVQNKAAQQVKVEPKKVFEQEKISDEARKIDILLKIGVFLVVLSGILFSTSSTGPIIDLFKPLFILALSGIFYGLSYIFKTKVKIKKSENTYYILSNLFLIFFAVALAYFKTFGEFLSFEGEGAEIVCSFISLLTALVIRNLGNKYEKEQLKVTSYMVVYLAIAFALSFFNASNILIISILLIISIVGNFKIDKNNTSYHTSRLIITLLLGAFAIIYNMTQVSDRETLFNALLSAGLLIANLYFLSQEQKTKEYNMLYSYTTFFLINTTIVNAFYVLFPATYNTESIANAFIYTSAFSLAAHHRYNKNEELKYGGFIITSILLAYSMMRMMIDTCSIILFITSAVLLAYSVYSIYKNNDETLQKIYFVLQMILIAIVIGTGVSALYEYFDILISASTSIMAYLCIAAIIDIIEDEYITKIKLDKFLYYAIIIAISLLSLILMYENSIIFNLIVLAILIGYRLYVNKYIQNNDILNCVILLVALFHLEYALYQVLETYAHPLLFVAFLLFGYFARKDKLTSVWSLALAYLPYLAMISELNLANEYQTILMATPALILVPLTVNLLLDINPKLRTGIEACGLVIIMLTLIFEVSLLIGLYVGVISLFMIFIGAKNDKSNGLFYAGIVSLILNIIVQLQEFWSKIPWFVYTLIAGLIIIFYVTYKEFNKDKNPKQKDKKIEYYEEKQYDTRKNIITLVLFLSFLVSIGVYGEIMYESKEKVEAKTTVEKFNQIGLDPNKYAMLPDNLNTIYILKGNTIDFKEVHSKLDLYGIYACWVDEEDFKKIKHGNSNYYYNCHDDFYYDEYTTLPKTEYNYNAFRINVLNKNLYTLDFYKYENNYSELTTFEINYNDYETESISFCIDRYDLDNYTISVNADYVKEIDGIGKCYEASSEHMITVKAKRNPIYYEPIIPTQSDDPIYN